MSIFDVVSVHEYCSNCPCERCERKRLSSKSHDELVKELIKIRNKNRALQRGLDELEDDCW